MIEVKQYKATAINLTPNPFIGNKPITVTGYYVKHITAQPYPISTPDEYEKFVLEHTKHYIFSNGFADWGLPTELEQYEIDPNTLEEIK